ncbi:MAG: disulfide oxidoreductase, partial [Shewanella sp. CG_4_9_14_0_8_um_filter_42_14]
AAFETLEDGARAHGFSGKEIDKLVKDLNKKIKKKRRGE